MPTRRSGDAIFVTAFASFRNPRLDACVANIDTSLSRAAREACVHVAYDHYIEGRFDEAEKLLAALQRAAPQDARVWMLQGSIKMLRGRFGDARPFFEQALELLPNDPYVLLALGEIELKTLRYQCAKPLFEKLLASDPERKHPAANRARALLQKARERAGKT